MSDKKKKKNKGAACHNEKKPQAAQQRAVLEEWFFMSKREASVLQIKEVLEQIEGADCEIWKEMGVIECTIPDSFCMDMEQIACDLQEEDANAFLKEHAIVCLYAVTIQADTLAAIEPVLQQLSAAFDGFFCGDTEDFSPMIGR